MSLWEALILGIVQGITEFLPVSSSGHLVLLQKIFGIQEPALVYDTAVHGGTLLAVVVVLRKDIWNILRRILQPLTLYIIVATIPAVIAALLFKHLLEEAFSSGVFLGVAFLLTSLLLLVSEKLAQKPIPARSQDEMTWVDALIIGLLQAVALIPGVSRSGATISGALSRKLDRNFAARFSFLLSIPAILGALVFQAKDFALLSGAPDVAGAAAGASIGLLHIAVGAISACITAFFSIHLALKIVREHSLKGFALYTGILGLLLLFLKI